MLWWWKGRVDLAAPTETPGSIFNRFGGLFGARDIHNYLYRILQPPVSATEISFDQHVVQRPACSPTLRHSDPAVWVMCR